MLLWTLGCMFRWIFFFKGRELRKRAEVFQISPTIFPLRRGSGRKWALQTKAPSWKNPALHCLGYVLCPEWEEHTGWCSSEEAWWCPPQPHTGLPAPRPACRVGALHVEVTSRLLFFFFLILTSWKNLQKDEFRNLKFPPWILAIILEKIKHLSDCWGPFGF